MRVLCDFHHSSLLRSLVLLFEKRLGAELYRPLGMEWFEEGYWAINNQRDTAEQFLALSSQPVDNTPALNSLEQGFGAADRCNIYDPGMKSTHRACTLDYFKNNKFDFVIASIPAHVPIFKDLIDRYQPEAKLIVQMGNNWQGWDFGDLPVLASVAGPLPNARNAVFYHQEFDLDVFHDTPVQPVRKMYSFVNVIQQSIAWDDFNELKRVISRQGWEMRAYGGQCPDGNMTGPHELASKMREASFIFHVKPGGDGYGHIIHNAYAVGRPIITRPSHYYGQMAEQLLVPGTFIDLDRYSMGEVKNILTRLMHDPDALVRMGKAAADRFDEVVDFKKEAREIEQWLKSL